MQVKPLGDRVLVKLVEEQERTQSGIYIPDTAKDKPQTGLIVAVGDGEDIKVKEGQRVLFAKFAGTEIKIGNEEHLILSTDDILAVVED
ncbi:co-chaperone GroES [Sulfobacillus thermosulfidooxidans]|uniref:Co-chaperonin GroES n=2 Tax=Sulfobacillus thermosulfidooxidans TaxID=28034 RepID=A0A1W1W9C2_SULTA|nr:co-chaperone GroES [Sulfobacillus thermosulfidooxidans]OLZ10848.1 co-chaperone GroES [Sulfobacillus thermosulfidooxidans]OLZ14336.1 co-chaperone GroES [Sulfobacillus thermosulfidooxidans]OLZ19079.1 co-chaperone GroES [Sulfobacillus thermosulfidooxidans]PSR28545.1 MAG: co-chaperone GroES [Sulfobacillus thermosulfidooxidans]SMC02640.1 chaperonin GroES [Sulfobacillus thermosulfidooxidans DSM 9293]